MPFVIRWPDDVSRVAPVPSQHPCRFVAGQPFTLSFQGETHRSREGESGHAVELLFDAPSEVEERLVSWQFADGSVGQSWVLPLPDVDQVKASRFVSGPWRGKHGVLANRRGAAVQARASWAALESKYDAFLSANLDSAGPGDRRIVLPAVRMTLLLGQDRHEIDGDAVAGFEAGTRSLQWWFDVHHIRFTAKLTLGEGNAVRIDWQMLSPVANDVHLVMTPLIDDRSFHHVTKAFQGAEERFPESLTAFENGFCFRLQDGHELCVEATTAFKPLPWWTYCVSLQGEAARGLETMTDVFSPGIFEWHPGTSPSFSLCAGIGDDEVGEAAAEEPRELSLAAGMRASLDLYLADRSGEITVIAGYPWFLDWGRDSLIFCRGLIADGRVEEAASIVRRFASFEENGTLPNLLRGSEVTNRETSDAPLWLIVLAGELVDAGHSIDMDCGGRTLREVLLSIVKAKQADVMDPDSGLLFSKAHHTWMDTDKPPCTPREGYPIEIQALWFRSLEVVAKRCKNRKAASLATRVAASIETLFWREQDGFFADCLHASDGTSARLAVADDHLRPNQWLAITLGAAADRTKARRALENSQCLLVPGAARSLAPRRVRHRLNVGFGVDPHHPYWPRYSGGEEVTRKPAYHNGTAWCWPYTIYVEAMLKVRGTSHRAAARSLLSASLILWRDGCVGQLPEVIDGDMPHLQRGCGAQAWSVSEWVRVWHLIERGK